MTQLGARGFADRMALPQVDEISTRREVSSLMVFPTSSIPMLTHSRQVGRKTTALKSEADESFHANNTHSSSDPPEAALRSHLRTAFSGGRVSTRA